MRKKTRLLLVVAVLGACLVRMDRAVAFEEQGSPERSEMGVSGQAAYTLQEVHARASDFFGGAAKELAQVIVSIFSFNGEPNAYIEGEEFSGSFFLGLRYGQGQLKMRDGREMPIYWQGPSLGVDLGGDAVRVFTLVYNLKSPQDIYRRIPGVAGDVYVGGGFSVSFQRLGDLVLAPVHSGVGARLGASVGYLSYSRSKQWVPF